MLKPKIFADFAKEFSGNIFETSSRSVDHYEWPLWVYKTSTKGESWGAGAKFLKKSTNVKMVKSCFSINENQITMQKLVGTSVLKQPPYSNVVVLSCAFEDQIACTWDQQHLPEPDCTL